MIFWVILSLLIWIVWMCKSLEPWRSVEGCSLLDLEALRETARRKRDAER